MTTQTGQVAITYLTQRYLWLICVLFGVVAIPNLLAGAVSNEASPHALMFSLGMPMLSVLPFLVGHVKTQFAHSRARLMPNFMRAHLAVLGGILVFAFLIYPLGIAWISRFEPLAPLALALAIGVPAIWGAQLNRFGPMLVSLIAFYSILTEWGLKWWLLDAASHRLAHGAIAAAGFGLLFAWLWRLTHLYEEMDDYQNVYQAMLARRTGSEASEQRRVVATQIGRNKFTARVGDWWHERLGGYYGGSQLSVIRLLRYGYTPMPIEVQALFMLAMMLVLGIFFSKFSYAHGNRNYGSLWFLFVFAIILPGQMAGEQLAQRRPRLSYEMLLPLARRQLLSGLFAAAARNSLVMWCMMTVGLGIVVVVIEMPLTATVVALFLLLSATATLTAVGLSLRLAIWPSMAKRMTVSWLCWMVLYLPVFGLWAARGQTGDWPLLAAAAALFALGVALINNARKTWLELELG